MKQEVKETLPEKRTEPVIFFCMAVLTAVREGETLPGPERAAKRVQSVFLQNRGEEDPSGKLKSFGIH